MTSKILHLPVTLSSELIIEGKKRFGHLLKKRKKRTGNVFSSTIMAHAAISIKESQINEKKARQIYLCKKKWYGTLLKRRVNTQGNWFYRHSCKNVTPGHRMWCAGDPLEGFQACLYSGCRLGHTPCRRGLRELLSGEEAQRTFCYQLKGGKWRSQNNPLDSAVFPVPTVSYRLCVMYEPWQQQRL